MLLKLYFELNFKNISKICICVPGPLAIISEDVLKYALRQKCRSYSGPHFPAFGLNTERYRLSVRIQSKCGNMRTE